MNRALKRGIQRTLGALCDSPLLRPCLRRSARRTVNVVYYHFAGAADPHYAAFYCGCTLKKLDDDLRRMARVFDLAPLPQVMAGGDRRRPLAAVTFDDGLDLRNAGVMEILDRHRVKATTFVITSCIGNGRLMWRHVLSAVGTMVSAQVWRRHFDEMARSHGAPALRPGDDLLAASRHWPVGLQDEWAGELWNRCGMPPVDEYLRSRRPYFDWDGLRAWLSAGHSVGFHTHSHPYCSRLEKDDLDRELIQPALALKRRLGLTQLSFSYPFGDRLRPDLEAELFATGVFDALFGIRGFSPRGGARSRLERASVEGADVGWAVFAASLFNSKAA